MKMCINEYVYLEKQGDMIAINFSLLIFANAPHTLIVNRVNTVKFLVKKSWMVIDLS